MGHTIDKTQPKKKFTVLIDEEFLRSPGFTCQEKVLYWLLQSYQRPGTAPFPSLGTLAKLMNLSEKSTGSVKNYLISLRKKGMLKGWKKRGFQKSNEYYLNQLSMKPIDATNQLGSKPIDNSNELPTNPSISSVRSPQSASQKARSIYQSSNNQLSYYHQELIAQVKETLPQLDESDLIQIIEQNPTKDILHAAQSVKEALAKGTKIPFLQKYFSRAVENEKEVEPEEVYKPAALIPSIFEDEKEYKARVRAFEKGYDEKSDIQCDSCGNPGITPEMIDYSRIFQDRWIDLLKNGKFLPNRLKNNPVALAILQEKYSRNEEVILCLRCINVIR